MDLFFGTSGPRSGAKIALVGEAWGVEEAATQKPFVGSSGKELDRMLNEAGIDRAACFCTNVASARPQNNEMWRFFEPTSAATLEPIRGLFPDAFIRTELLRLEAQLKAVSPVVVLALGNYALWALTLCAGYSNPAEAEGRRVPFGIDSWRGSLWFCDALPGPLAQLKLIPLYHPAFIMRAWYNRAVTVQDLRVRVPMALRNDWRPQPAPVVLAPPTFEEARARLTGWHEKAESGTKFRLVSDVETIPSRGLMSCAGFADSKNFAITIPFVRPKEKGKILESYWSFNEELTLVKLIRSVLSHPNVLVEGQNYLYDTQWFVAFLACLPHIDFDTMLAQNLLFPGTPKDLGYLSSLYCHYHWYWKDDGKDWDLKEDPRKLWGYNALDCLRQFECGTVLRELIPKLHQSQQWQETLERNALALRMMLKGVRIDKTRRAHLVAELIAAAGDFERWFLSIVPQRFIDTKSDKLWFRSNKQQKQLFADVLGLNLPKHRKRGNATLGKEGLDTLIEKHPEFKRLFVALKDYRSVEVFHKTFCAAPLDFDERMRCMFNVAGTETFRWSSSENAFGRGTNLQNIPKGTEE